MIDPYAVIKDALEPTGLTVRNSIPPADRTKATFLVVSIDPSSSRGSRPGWVERVSVAVEAWVGDGEPESRKQRATSTALTARDALWEAWQTRRTTPTGAINFLPEVPWPTLTPSGLDGVWRTRFQVDITVRR